MYLIFLNFFLSFNSQMISSQHTVKNHALIASFSMAGQKGCFIQRLSVVTIYSEGNRFCRRFTIPILFHFQGILTYEDLHLSSQLKTFIYRIKYKHNVILSYIGTHQINSLRLFIQNLYIRKVSHFKPQFGQSTQQN